MYTLEGDWGGGAGGGGGRPFHSKVCCKQRWVDEIKYSIKRKLAVEISVFLQKFANLPGPS